MTTPSTGHRASALRRRSALLDAAADLAAELGAGSVTHRAVAARAGVPLSTTSYFFASIDDLVAEALAKGAAKRATAVQDIERATCHGEGPLADRLLTVADSMVACPRTAQAAVVEHLLARGRAGGDGEDATGIEPAVARAEAMLAAVGAQQSRTAAGAFVVLCDGATLHHLAEGTTVDDDGEPSEPAPSPARERFADGLRLLLAAAALTDDEVEGLLSRYDRVLSAEHASVPAT